MLLLLLLCQSVTKSRRGVGRCAAALMLLLPPLVQLLSARVDRGLGGVKRRPPALMLLLLLSGSVTTSLEGVRRHVPTLVLLLLLLLLQMLSICVD
jgi:hypothetical protein